MIDYIVESKDSAIGEVLFDDPVGSFAADIVADVARGEKRGDVVSDSSNYNKMRVATLRRILDEKGLNIDGSREAMVALLKENS